MGKSLDNFIPSTKFFTGLASAAGATPMRNDDNKAFSSPHGPTTAQPVDFSTTCPAHAEKAYDRMICRTAPESSPRSSAHRPNRNVADEIAAWRQPATRHWTTTSTPPSHQNITHFEPWASSKPHKRRPRPRQQPADIDRLRAIFQTFLFDIMGMRPDMEEPLRRGYETALPTGVELCCRLRARSNKQKKDWGHIRPIRDRLAAIGSPSRSRATADSSGSVKYRHTHIGRSRDLPDGCWRHALRSRPTTQVKLTAALARYCSANSPRATRCSISRLKPARADLRDGSAGAPSLAAVVCPSAAGRSTGRAPKAPGFTAISGIHASTARLRRARSGPTDDSMRAPAHHPHSNTVFNVESLDDGKRPRPGVCGPARGPDNVCVLRDNCRLDFFVGDTVTAPPGRVRRIACDGTRLLRVPWGLCA